MSQGEFEKKLLLYIESEQLIKPADRIAAAVSGGADSTALLYALWSIKKQNILTADLICVHVNHQLREADSSNDEKFVIELANKLEIPVVKKKIDVRDYAKTKKISIETAARELRIRALMETAKERGCNIIATGHQVGDNAETVIHRLLRGTGFRGLCGINPKKVFGDGLIFIRPLLCFTRKEICEYLSEKGLSWRTDATNEDLRYTRNYIRHRLLSDIQTQGRKPIANALLRLSQAALKFQNKVIGEAQRQYRDIASSQSDSITLDTNKFVSLHPAVKTELIFMVLKNLSCPERNLTSEHYGKILELAQNSPGNKKIDLPSFFTVRKEYGSLIFERRPLQQTHKEKSFEEIEVRIPEKIRKGDLDIETSLLEAGQIQFECFKKNKSEYTECFDYEKIIPPVIIRKRKSGDKFHPLGLAREKKVGKFLTDEKIPPGRRDKIMIVSDSEKIIWVWPVRISDGTKLTDKTKIVLKIQVKRQSN
jgi:tRNA(Ile)-lysidine synthase